jgi:hypothetical protein
MARKIQEKCSWGNNIWTGLWKIDRHGGLGIIVHIYNPIYSGGGDSRVTIGAGPSKSVSPYLKQTRVNLIKIYYKHFCKCQSVPLVQ